MLRILDQPFHQGLSSKGRLVQAVHSGILNVAPDLRTFALLAQNWRT
jgi:hypothetical protein